MGRFVYPFNEGSRDMYELLGRKGANLAEMTRIGLPVPFGFTVTTEACNRYYAENCVIADDIVDEIYERLADLENVTGKALGSGENPLLLSVRSGAVASMPGMMDTILNLGLNDTTVEGLARKTGNERFAYDSYKRFVQMYGEIAMGISKKKFDKILEEQNKMTNADEMGSPTVEVLKAAIKQYKELAKEETGMDFPEDTKEQLIGAIRGVFNSWNNERSILYREFNKIPDDIGTAVNVQSMVFGNLGYNSATGVAFTRNPSTGEHKLFGEFLVNAQGEDVVAGIRTPHPISEMEKVFPNAYSEFQKIANILEKHYHDMQDMEFTIENNKLYMLQTRAGKRTAAAAIKIAVDMEREDLIDKETAIMRVNPNQIGQLLHPTFDKNAVAKAKILAKGIPASPGAACGKICFRGEDAVAVASEGQSTILVRSETSPRDFEGMVAASGILTARGGSTSHAAVVARGMGKCCIVGCHNLVVDAKNKTLTIGQKEYKEGEYISLDGGSGLIYDGNIETVQPDFPEEFSLIMKWANEVKTLKVRATADNPIEAVQAIAFGADGIGLCRTEQMFLEEKRLPLVRKIILTECEDERNEALSKLLEYHKGDFKSLYNILEDRPMTVRLLDLPLHELLPYTDEEVVSVAAELDIPVDKVYEKVYNLQEFNPMFGHRGCRLAITNPEFAKMQTEAILMAAIELKKEKNIDVVPEILVSLVSSQEEMATVRKIINGVAQKCFEREGITIEYSIGAVIEVPRAALTADKIAKEADFFSFGTNDMTQMIFGLSVDDATDLIRDYKEKEIFSADPFQTIDYEGVGRIIKMAMDLGKATRPNLKFGMSGAHSADPSTVKFCHEQGLNYISCTPFGLPAARIAAAQSAIIEREK